MSVLRLLVAGAVACALAVGARADEKKADNAKLLVGTWEVVKADQGTVEVGATVEFAKDGKMKVTHKNKEGKEETAEGTYTIDGQKLMVTIKFGDKEAKHTVTLKKLTDTELVGEGEKGTAEFKRKK